MDLAGVLGQLPDPGVGLVAPPDALVGQRLEQHLDRLPALVPRPGADDLHRVVEGFGVAQRGDLLERPQAHLRVAVALHGGDQEAALELPLAIEVQHRLGPPPAVGRHAGAGQRRPHVLLAVIEVLDGDPPQLPLEDLRPAVGVRSDGQDPPLHPHAPPAAAPHRPHHDRAAPVDVAVQERVQRHHRVVVLGGRVDEVDDDPRLLARLPPRHAAHPLLVDPPGGGGRQVHAHRGPRRVPALGQQLGVDQHVDLASLVGGEDAGQLALGRLARGGLRLDPGAAHRLGHVVGVPDAGGVHHARHRVEAGLVEVGHGDVERELVQQLGQHLLIELGVHLAPAQRDLGDRAHPRPRRDPDAAQRRDHAAPRGLGQVEARGLGGEEVGDVTGDQRAGGGHPDEHGARPAADRGAGLLAQRRVRLVADDDRVGVGDPAGVAHEPLVGLDGHRPVGRVLAVQQRRRDALGVAAIAQLAVELVHQVATVGEDQDPARARSLHEAHRGHRLARPGGVLEPEAPGGVGILGLFGKLDVLLELALVPV